MSTGTLEMHEVCVARPISLSAKLAAYFELTKPKIAVMVLLAVAIAYLLGTRSEQSVPFDDGMRLIWTLLGTALVASSASAVNQWIERDLDSLMPRTRNRPLPSGTLSSAEVLTFAALTLAGGLLLLAARTNVLATLMAAGTWICYTLLYTPLKTRSTSNTAIGAVAGAWPVLIGWAAVEAPFDFGPASLRLLTLFLVLYLWQFPHFMAIAWIYRRDYALGGMRMLTVSEPSGKHAGSLAVRTALVLLPVSLLPCAGVAAWWGVAATLGLGLLYFVAAYRFQQAATDQTARRLLHVSLVYLPLWMVVLWLLPTA
jgi:protoheme IX farnesyltransferase